MSPSKKVEEFLREVLKDGPTPAKTIKDEALEAGHSWATVRRAADSLHVIKRKGGMSDGWFWYAPEQWPKPIVNRMVKKPPFEIESMHETDEPCIYFLFGEDESLIYIGQTTNLKNRLVQHKEKNFKSFISCKLTDQIERLALEKTLIKLLRPEHNRT